MQQPQQQKQQNRYHAPRLRGGPVAYEEKSRVIEFAPEDDQDTDSSVKLRNGNVKHSGPTWSMLDRRSERHSSGITSDFTDYDEDDGRQRSRVKTRPVVGTRATDVAALYQHRSRQYNHHPPVRTQPQSRAPSVSNYTVTGGSGAYFDNQPYENPQQLSRQVQQQPMPPPTTVQPPVAKRVAAGQQRKQQQQQQLQSSNESQWVRQRASSESSFGGRLFFGWRRTNYEGAGGQRPENSIATADIEQQPSQYRGKNLHNFSFTDAKIYSPQSPYQQNEQQQQKQILQHSKQQNQKQTQQQHRAKIWWTMETMGAVKSAHSNQMLLAKGAPKAVKVQGDYC